MNQTLYATFQDPALAEKAIGALLDHGAVESDLSLLASQSNQAKWADRDRDEAQGKHGISTTTSKDAASGAAKGAGIGLGIGTIAAIASLIIPGFGIVIGSGALATAVASALGTTAAGALAGGVAGFLKDQGVDEKVARTYEESIAAGHALLALNIPSGRLDQTMPMRLTPNEIPLISPRMASPTCQGESRPLCAALPL